MPLRAVTYVREHTSRKVARPSEQRIVEDRLRWATVIDAVQNSA